MVKMNGGWNEMGKWFVWKKIKTQNQSPRRDRFTAFLLQEFADQQRSFLCSDPFLLLLSFFILSLYHSFLSLYSSAIFNFHVSIYKKGSFKTIYVFIKISLMAIDLTIELLFKQTSHFVIEISSLFFLVKGILS